MHAQRKDRSKTAEIRSRHTINPIFFSEDGGSVLNGDAKGILRQWQVDDGLEVDEENRVAAEICAAALSPDRKWLVYGLHASSKPNVKMWDTKSPGKSLNFKGHAHTVTSVDISHDSTKLATGSNGKRARIWDILRPWKRCLVELRHDGPVVAVRFSPNSDRLATATVHQSIRIFDSKNGRQLLAIPCPFFPGLFSPLAWSADGCQLYAASYMAVRHFKISQQSTSAESLGEWLAPGGSSPQCIALSHNQQFIAVAADRSLSFWDASMHEQIGSVMEHDNKICSMMLSPHDDFIATSDEKGKITVRSLRDVLPDTHLPRITREDERLQHTAIVPPSVPQSLLMHINDAVYESWMRGDLAHAEHLLSAELQRFSHNVYAFAHRALVRCHLKKYDEAMVDAQKSIDAQSSVIGHIASIISRVGKDECDSALHLFDLAYTHSSLNEHGSLLLIKAILLFECGKRDEAISLLSASIPPEPDASLHMTVKARMLFLLRNARLGRQDCEQTLRLSRRVQDTIPSQGSSLLVEISLITGWDLNNIHVQDCIKSYEDMGDAAAESNNLQEAIQQYSTALSLRPSNAVSLLVKRSKARGSLASWEDALNDANEAVAAGPRNPLGYERKYMALHALQRYDEAVGVLDLIVSLDMVSHGTEPQQLVENFALAKKKIEEVVRDVLKTCPFVLVEVKPESGLLCDESERMGIFKSEPQFKKLLSSMTHKLDVDQIRQVVAKYFQYVTFSHVWEGNEPSYQDVKKVLSVWEMESSPLNNKLRKFCEVVREGGYRWAWSDTCCINKEDNDVLHESLNKMYRWYEESAATFALLADVNSPTASRGLKDSKWMTRAWTSQELLAPKIIQFYDHNWEPYLGDIRANHKESRIIMQEVADAVGLAPGTIKAFDPHNLSILEKLRLASTREATREEDIAYSLIGILQSDIRPHYGEGPAALGHLLADIIARSGDVTALAWAGQPSSYHTCLPASLSVYKQIPHPLPPLGDAEMVQRVRELKHLLANSEVDVIPIYNQIVRLPPVRFAHRRLQLPCVIFEVTGLRLHNFGVSQDYYYHAQASGIGVVEIHTAEKLPLTEPRKLILVHPWLCDLRDPPDGFIRVPDDRFEASVGAEINGVSSPPSPLRPRSATAPESDTRALRLLVRLQQPFRALLLLQRGHKEFRRVASEHEIMVPGLDLNCVKDICAEVLEIL